MSDNKRPTYDFNDLAKCEIGLDHKDFGENCYYSLIPVAPLHDASDRKVEDAYLNIVDNQTTIEVNPPGEIHSGPLFTLPDELRVIRIDKVRALTVFNKDGQRITTVEASSVTRDSDDTIVVCRHGQEVARFAKDVVGGYVFDMMST